MPDDVIQKLVTPESPETEVKQELIKIVKGQVIIPKELIPESFEGFIKNDPFNLKQGLGEEFSNIIYSEVIDIVEIQSETVEQVEIKAERKEDRIEIQISDNVFMAISLEKQGSLPQEIRAIPKISIAISLLH